MALTNFETQSSLRADQEALWLVGVPAGLVLAALLYLGIKAVGG